MNLEEFLDKVPDDWRRGPAVRKWMTESDSIPSHNTISPLTELANTLNSWAVPGTKVVIGYSFAADLRHAARIILEFAKLKRA